MVDQSAERKVGQWVVSKVAYSVETMVVKKVGMLVERKVEQWASNSVATSAVSMVETLVVWLVGKLA